MPRPVFVICTEGVSQDKASNALTLFAILERVVVNAHSGSDSSEDASSDPERFAAPLAAFESTTVAVWKGELGDEDRLFEHEYALHYDGKCHAVPNTRREFQFNMKRPLQRFIMRMSGLPAVGGSGVIEFESRVREAGTQEWAVQRYPVACELRDPEATDN